MYALMTKIAILRQNANMENVIAKEKELETGKTAEVWLLIFSFINTVLIEGKINWSWFPWNDI